MSSLSASPIPSEQKRSRPRCRHLDKFRKQLEEQGILLEEVINSADCYCVLPITKAEDDPIEESDADEDSHRWKSDHKELITTIEKGFDKVGFSLAKLAQENESLKQNLAQQVGVIGREVDPEYFHWILTILATGSIRSAALALGIKKSTLGDRVTRYSSRGGTYAFLHGLVKVRRRVLGTRKLEHYNED